MKLHQHTSAQQHMITGMDTETIAVNQQRYDCALIVSGDTLIEDWYSGRWEALQAESLLAILDLKPEVVLLGTGDKHRFIHPKLIQAFLAANIAVECMTTAAACRTFNILTSEGRHAVAALLLEKHLFPA